MTARTSFTPGGDRRQLHEPLVGGLADDVREGRLARAGRAPQHHRGGPGRTAAALPDQPAQRRAGAQQMLLAHDLVQGARAHPYGQRAGGRVLRLAFLGGCGEQIGLHAETLSHRSDSAARAGPPARDGAAGQLVQKSHQRVRISMPMTPMCSTGTDPRELVEEAAQPAAARAGIRCGRCAR